MTLAAGAPLGPYEIVAPLGSGGMGEVYRARDARLNRDVAIKVLPELFTQDPDRLTRFRREAQVLAALNHTNIAHLYGLEDSAGAHALVMELVEGPTLADRIAQGPVPLDEALAIARQVADALECAHDQGIIHRDLKPANVKVRPDGAVKVLDFGLAKAFDPATGSSAEAVNSPTLTARGTQLGIIVGTAAYMSPEQARGRAVDRRADIWAFGVVLFELLTGQRAFEGDDISITLASVLKDDVNWKALPADTPPSVVRVLRRCLEKDPKKRLSAVGDARFDLDEVAPDQSRPSPANRKGLLPWSLTAAMAALAIAAFALWGPWRRLEPAVPLRMSVEVGAPGSLHTTVSAPVVISPDGRTLAILMRINGRSQLFVRSLSELNAVPLAGTEDAFGPFFSPDSHWIGFFAGGKLKKIAATGGAVMPLCDAPDGRGGAWTTDGSIIFQNTAGLNAPLKHVSDGGGAVKDFTTLTNSEVTHRWPQILPGGHVLYTANTTGLAWDAANIVVQPRSGGAPKILKRGGFHGRYVSSGHLLYMNRATLYAAPFDLQRLEVTGNAVPVIDGVLTTLNTGGAHFSVSDAGTLVYVAGQAAASETPIFVTDSAAKLTVLRQQPANWYSPRYSPDGAKLAVVIGTGPSDIWIHEPGRDLTKLTFGSGTAPVWTPNGRRIAFGASVSGAPLNLFWQRSNGTGEPQRLTTSPNVQVPTSIHRTGRVLAFHERTPDNGLDIRLLPIEGDEQSGWKFGTPTTFLGKPYMEAAAAFSPDGRWIAYHSNESARTEVYVRPFPSGDDKLKVSTAGGSQPVWSLGTRQLFYLQPGAPQTVMSITYQADDVGFRAQPAVPWTTQKVQSHGPERPYDVHPLGKHVVFIKPPDDDAAAQARDKGVFILNFFDELRRVAPVK